jgi:hypothetical protein
MRRSLLKISCIGLLLTAQAALGQIQRALLSVNGLSIPDGGAMAAFQIDTWGVIPLAVCQVPPLWELKEEKFMDSAAVFSGRSDPYHRTLMKLDRLFLVDVYSYQRFPIGDPKGEYHPPSFDGWFTVFDGNGDVIKKRRRFLARDFHLMPAARCPDAPPAEP